MAGSRMELSNAGDVVIEEDTVVIEEDTVESEAMGEEKTLVEIVITSAMQKAAVKASAGDLAHGLLAGLRQIRMAVGSQAGAGAAGTLDDSLRALLAEFALRRVHAAGRMQTVPVPPPGPDTIRASAIIEDAAMSCLALNAYGPGNAVLSEAVRALASALVDQLGGAPAWPEVASRLHRDEDAMEETGFGDHRSVALH